VLRLSRVGTNRAPRAQISLPQSAAWQATARRSQSNDGNVEHCWTRTSFGLWINVIDAHPGQRGAGALAAALGDHHAGTTVTRSALEEAFLGLCAAHALERPQTNVRVCGLEVDFLFAAQRLVVEADTWRFHRTRRAFERDRQRDAILARAGYRTLRFTHRQMTGAPAEVAQTIRSSA
jgi:very-short-patch-repair endonuclease